MKKVVIFASGSGSNAQKIMENLKENPVAKVVAVFCNKPGAGVITRSEKAGVPCILFGREDMSSGKLFADLSALGPDLIVLAGFLWKVPEEIVQAFPQKIINIHPALLPHYGGKGMFGMHVHEAVIKAGEKETGITIHYVNERYDEGAVIFQASVPVEPRDTARTIAEKVHQLEHRHFSTVILEILAQA